MSETLSSDDSGDRARVIPGQEKEPMTDAQREALVTALDASITGQPEVETIRHEHRKRALTRVPIAATEYAPSGLSVQCTRVRDMRTLKVVAHSPSEPGRISGTTEKVFEVRPDSPADDYYDEVTREVGADEQIRLKESPDHTLTQSRWQEAMDVLDQCTPDVMVRPSGEQEQ